MGLSAEQAEAMYQLCSQYRTDCIRTDFLASAPQHRVRMDGFWIYRMEVSNALYAACERAEACTPPAKRTNDRGMPYYGDPAFNDYPAFANWQQADAYCRWAGGSLPTEAQWEYAARGEDGRLFPWGDQPPTSPGMANVNDQEGDTLPVGSYRDYGSSFGVLDLAGNAWEWVSDWYRDDYFTLESDWANPTGPASGVYKVGKGGSYGWSPAAACAGLHDYSRPDTEYILGVGFRCVIPAP
jgi:formylglycine-generating enzyme required for sulfatase activity